MAYTTTELLAEIRRRAKISDSDPDYTTANLLLEADAQLNELIVPVILAARSDYYVRTEDQAITADVSAYPIPSRAVASVPRQVYVVDSASESREIPFVTLAERHLFPASGEPVAYTVVDDTVVLLPTPSRTVDTLRIAYEYQPNALIAASSCAITEDYDGALGTFSCTSVPTTWTNSTILDIVSGTSPFSVLGVALDPTTVVTGASGTVDFVLAQVPSRITEGDYPFYLCPTGYTCVPQLPADMHSMLALAVVCEILDQH